MNYGQAVLSSAVVLPATVGAGLLLENNANPVIVAGLFVISIISITVSISSMVRYLINSKN